MLCLGISDLTFRHNFASLFHVSAVAWVVECADCKCIIVSCGIDPQEEHGRPAALVTPLKSAVLTCPCCGSDYRYAGGSIVRGVPKRNPACQRRHHTQPQALNGAMLVAASIVAAIRLRGEAIKPSPKVAAAVADSVQLARMVAANLERN